MELLYTLKLWTRWVAKWLLIGLIGLQLLVWIGHDDSDGPWPHHSGLTVMKDAKTGCEYLSTPQGLTPRLDRDGRPLCVAVRE